MYDSYITIPENIWWLIFSKFKNPLRILRLSIVSHEFELFIEEYFEKNEILKKLCEGNIEIWAYQILSKVYPNKLIDLKQPLSQEELREVLKYYYKWRSPRTFSTLVTAIGYGSDKEITCSTIWRDFLIAGSNSGEIFFSDIEKDHDDVVIVFKNKDPVKNLKVWRAEKDLEVVVVQLQNKSLKFYNLTTQDEEPLPTLLMYNATNICVGVDHRLFADNGYHITEYKFDNGRIIFRRTCDLTILLKSNIKMGSKLLTMHSELDLVMVVIQIDDEVHLFELYFSTKIYDDPKLRNVKVIKVNNFFDLHNPFISIVPIKELELIFSENIIMACSEKFSKNGKACKDYTLFDFKNDFITCATMLANILLLGWNSGLFSKIYINTLEDFCNFNNPPHRQSDTFQLTTDPIVAINLGEYGGTSYIIVATKNMQYFITDKKYSDEIHRLTLNKIDDYDYFHPAKKMRLS